MREMVDIDVSALDARLAAMPDRKAGQQRFYPEEWQKTILLKYWKTKGHDVVADALGVSVGVASRWYKEVMDGRLEQAGRGDAKVS